MLIKCSDTVVVHYLSVFKAFIKQILTIQMICTEWVSSAQPFEKMPFEIKSSQRIQILIFNESAFFVPKIF